MSRFVSFLGVAFALLFGAVVASFSGGVTTYQAPVIPGISSSVPSLPATESVELETVASEQVQKTPHPANTTIPSPIEKITASVKTALSPSESSSLDASATALRSALVNIICYAPAGSRLRSTSGSGVIIDSKGIILTNAHIAQNFLLAGRNVTCTIRAGSPAADTYETSLIYIPSAWINANADILTEVNPSGTGEYDFAFLAIDKSANRDELPQSFPFLPLATVPASANAPVVIASYGAQFLESSQIRSSLFPTVVFGSVKNVFTFASTSVDVLALGGSAAAQEGSSGGGISDINGQLVGTITTSTTKGTTDTRSLDAITASYIRAEYFRETGETLDALLSKPTSLSIADFALEMPALESILTAQLN